MDSERSAVASLAGRGYGTEYAAALMAIAFDGLGVRRVEANCFADNLASRRLMEKFGMRLEGHFREDSLHRSGRWLDGMSFALMAIFLWLGKVGPAILVGLGGVVFLVLGVLALRRERRTYGHHHADGCAAE